MNESDGIEEALYENLREALYVAEQLGRQWASVIGKIREIAEREREEAARRAAAQARYQAVWDKAREKLAVVDNPQWWRQATVVEIAEVHEVVTAWREHETEAARIDVVYRRTLERYEMSVISSEQVHEAPVYEAPREDRSAHASAEYDFDGAGPLVPEPTAGEKGEAALPPWDSAERRVLMEQRMRESGVSSELIKVHMRVHRMNARPPQAAVRDRRRVLSSSTSRSRVLSRQLDKPRAITR